MSTVIYNSFSPTTQWRHTVKVCHLTTFTSSPYSLQCVRGRGERVRSCGRSDGVSFFLFLSQSVFNRIRCEVLLYMWAHSLSSHLSYSLMKQCDINDLLNQSGLTLFLSLSPLILSSSFLTVSTCQGNSLFISFLFSHCSDHYQGILHMAYIAIVQHKHFQC